MARRKAVRSCKPLPLLHSVPIVQSKLPKPTAVTAEVMLDSATVNALATLKQKRRVAKAPPIAACLDVAATMTQAQMCSSHAASVRNEEPSTCP